MQRINSAGVASNLFGAGKNGFTEGNSVTGVPATVVGMDFMNDTQEEIAGLIEGSGLALSSADNKQALKASKRLFGGFVTTLSANATLTLDQCGLVLISAALGNVTITLPAASALAAAQFVLARTDSVTANTVTIQRAGADLVGGVTSFTLPVGGRARLISDGVNAWYRPGQAVPAGGLSTFIFTPAANTTYSRTLSFTPVSRGRVHAQSYWVTNSSMTSAARNTISIAGVTGGDVSSNVHSLVVASAAVEPGAVMVIDGTLAFGAGTVAQLFQQVSYIFVPEVG